MKVEVIVAHRFARRVPRRKLEQFAVSALQAETEENGIALTINIVGDKEMRKYNRRFHHIDSSTDVLSFPCEQSDYLGDVIISYETAKANARAARWRIEDELRLLITHGILHLSGYDDRTSKARAKMWQRQRELLQRSIPDTV